MSGPAERLWDNAVEVTAALVTGVWMLAMFTGQSWWLPALLVGYVVVRPGVTVLPDEADEVHRAVSDGSGARSAGTATDSTDEALGTLRERYARGELTEEQFERKLERILAVETVEDAREEYASGRSGGREEEVRPSDERRERETETE